MAWLGRFALALASIAFVLGIGEGLVRALDLGGTTRSRGPLHQHDPLAGWACARDVDTRYELPGAFDVRVRCNAEGLRDSEDHPAEKPAGRHRVAVLGDSFMWGFGVENDETFAEALERELRDTDALSFAANGYSTIQSLVRFERDAVRYAPDWTVLFVCWNDLEDNFDDKDGGRPIARLDGAGGLEIANSPVAERWKSPVKQWFQQRSRLFLLGEYALELGKAALGELEAEDELGDPANPRVVGRGHRERISRLELYAPPGEKLERAWRALELAIERLDRGAREHGGRLLVAWIPTPESTQAQSFARLFQNASGQPLAEGLDWDRPARRLAQISAERGIPFVDPQPAFRTAEQPESLFLPNNGHWSPAGHALAARVVADRIRSESPELY